MLLIYGVIWSFMVLASASALLALLWSIQSGQFDHLEQTALLMFEPEERAQMPCSTPSVPTRPSNDFD